MGEMMKVCYFLLILLAATCLAEQEPKFERISENRFPALVFVQEDINCAAFERSSLMVATFEDGKAVVQKVMTAQYIKAAQLSDTVFLLEADQRPEDRSLWEQTHFLVDFSTGSCVLVSRSRSVDKLVHIVCLRSDPDKNEAVILRYGQGTDKGALIQIDLTTLETNELYTLPRTETTLAFSEPHMRISPDFKKAAAMVSSEQDDQRRTRPFTYVLRVLDLESMKITELDNEVAVEVSPFSSIYPGRPPFEWVSSEDILYQHMVPNENEANGLSFDAECVLKCINVGTKRVTEWVKKRMPLTLDGGDMHFDWLTGELRYNDYTIDVTKYSLVPYRPWYYLEDSNGTEIRFNGGVVCRYSGRQYVQPCASFSCQDFAYFIRSYDKAAPTIYAQTRDMKQPIVVAEVPFYTWLVTWIEDTSCLRKGHLNKDMDKRQKPRPQVAGG